MFFSCCAALPGLRLPTAAWWGRRWRGPAAAARVRHVGRAAHDGVAPAAGDAAAGPRRQPPRRSIRLRGPGPRGGRPAHVVAPAARRCVGGPCRPALPNVPLVIGLVQLCGGKVLVEREVRVACCCFLSDVRYDTRWATSFRPLNTCANSAASARLNVVHGLLGTPCQASGHPTLVHPAQTPCSCCCCHHYRPPGSPLLP